MKRHIEEEVDSAMVPLWQGFYKKNLELHIKSSDAVLKNQILATDWIELPTSSEKEWIIILPRTIPFLAVLGLSFHTEIRHFYRCLLSHTHGPINNKLLNCKGFLQNFTILCETAR